MFTTIDHDLLRRAHVELERLRPLLPPPIASTVHLAEDSMRLAVERLREYDVDGAGSYEALPSAPSSQCCAFPRFPTEQRARTPDARRAPLARRVALMWIERRGRMLRVYSGPVSELDAICRDRSAILACLVALLGWIF